MFSTRAQPHELSPGDHLCVRRCGLVYSHHGIYSGDGRVIHYTDIQGLVNKHLSRVVETALDEFLQDGTLRRRSHPRTDDSARILARAREALNKQDYHLVFNNCEHFATWCATGRKKSPQVRRAAMAVASAVTVVAGAVISRAGRRSRT